MRSLYDVWQPYLGDGLVSEYTFDFKIEALEHLRIIKLDDAGDLVWDVRGNDTEFVDSIEFDNELGGGTVTLIDPLEADYKLLIVHANDAATQPFQFKNKFDLTLARLEAAFDWVTGWGARALSLAQKSFRLHDADDASEFDMTIPPGLVGQESRIPHTNDEGSGWAEPSEWTQKADLAAAIAANEAAQIAADEAEASATAALVSENNAEAAAAAASISETNAAADAASVLGSVAASAASAAAALISENNAAASAAAALVSEGNAETAAASADTDADAAAISAAAALVSENNAEAAEVDAEAAAVDAAASAAQAAAIAAGGALTTVETITFADSPKTLIDTDMTKLFLVDTSGGAVVINLPEIATILTAANIGFKKLTPDANTVTINPFAGDEIDEDTNPLIMTVQNEGSIMIPDATATPDNWASIFFGISSDNPTVIVSSADFGVDEALLLSDGITRVAKASTITETVLAAAIAEAAAAQIDADQALLDAAAAQTTADDHIADTAGAHAATAIAFTPAGSIAANTVQAAVEEVSGDVAAAQSDADQALLDAAAAQADADTANADLATHAADTSTHGVTTVAGISEAQVFTNKDIDGGTASNTNRLTVPKNTLANLTALTRKEATLVYASDEDTLYHDDGAALNAVGSGGGGGGALQWIESDAAPLIELENYNRVAMYVAGGTQNLYAAVRVPATYRAGKQIKMRILSYSPDVTGTALIATTGLLIRKDTDAITSTTNQRNSTNSAINLASAPVANKIYEHICDLTSTIGEINSVAVAAGDLIIVQLRRGTDTATSDLRALLYSAEVTFNG